MKIVSKKDHPYCITVLRKLTEALNYVEEAMEYMPTEGIIGVLDLKPVKPPVMLVEDIFTDLNELIADLEDFYYTPKMHKGEGEEVLKYLQKENPNVREFDTALPAQWVAMVCEQNFGVDRFHFTRGTVWAYGDGIGPWGIPMAISDYARDILSKLNV